MATQRKTRVEAPGGQAGGISADYVFSELSPTAARILAAAQRVLRRDGYAGVTLQRVAAEAGEHKSLVIYHFGNKATLLSMLVDSLWHDLDVELFHSVEDLPEQSERRIHALIDSQRRLGRLTDQQQMYMDLFPELTRRSDTRRQLGDLTRSYRDLHRRFLSATGLESDQLMALAGLVLAIGDGMAVCLLVRPDDIDDGKVYRLLEDAVLSLTRGVWAGMTEPPVPAITLERRPPRPRSGNGLDAGSLDPLADLPPVARKLVRGARTVLRRRGFQALTLDAVGREAGEPRSSITYYFGDKQGLVTALVRMRLHEERKVAGRLLTAAVRGHDCAGEPICAAGELLRDMPSFRTFFDLLPVMIREPEFRRMQGENDRWLTGVIAAGLQESGVPALAANADALAVMQLAAADGLAMQMLSDPSGFDPQPSLTILGRLIRHHVPGDTAPPAGATPGAG
jgi:AcrR family transcriptional regulator